MFSLEAFNASGTCRECFQPKLVPDFLSSTILWDWKQLFFSSSYKISIFQISKFLTSSWKWRGSSRSALECGFEWIKYSITRTVTSRSCMHRLWGHREYKGHLISVVSAPLWSTFLRKLGTLRTLVGSYQSFCVQVSRGTPTTALASARSPRTAG